MDTRYTDRGYSVTLLEEKFGAFLTISRNGKAVGEVSLGIFSGGPDEPVQMIVKRFKPGELPVVKTVDDFDSSR